VAPELIYCADGNPRFAAAAVAAGWRYGARLPAKVYQSVHFADQDWRRPDRDGYMRALRAHRPAVATVLDWERAEQFGEVMSWAAEASRHVARVVVVAKVSGLCSLIPRAVGGAEVLIGYSVPTAYGGSEICLWEIGRRPVHLLGGSPQKQLSLARYLNVVSVDGNMAHQQAHRCRYWSRKKGPHGHWRQLGGAPAPGDNLRCFARSLENIATAWRAA